MSGNNFLGRPSFKCLASSFVNYVYYVKCVLGALIRLLSAASQRRVITLFQIKLTYPKGVYTVFVYICSVASRFLPQFDIYSTLWIALPWDILIKMSCLFFITVLEPASFSTVFH